MPFKNLKLSLAKLLPSAYNVGENIWRYSIYFKLVGPHVRRHSTQNIGHSCRVGGKVLLEFVGCGRGTEN